MRLRFPLLLKKRGRRRTGSPRWAQAGELAYQLMFVVAGLIGGWWLFDDVLLPEWRLSREADRFEEAVCRVVDSRVVARPGLAEPEYCAELLVRFVATDEEQLEVWTRHGVGRDAPSREEAAGALDRFTLGDDLPCWYDPTDPTRVLLSVNRRWWPWLILSVPASLVIAGSIGVGITLLSTQSSPERRATLTRRVTAAAVGDGSPASAALALPSIEATNDSPGVRLAYRLPMDVTDGWRVLGMAAVCVLWNALAAVFAFQLTAGALPVGGRIGLAALAILPLAATGVWLVRSLVRDARSAGGGGVTRIEIARHPLRPGDRCRAALIQTSPIRTRAVTVALVCAEKATFHQGTDTRITTAEVFREVVYRERGAASAAGAGEARTFEVPLPADGPPSFTAPNNRVSWSLEVIVGPPRRPDSVSRFRLCVYPPTAAEPSIAADADEAVPA